MHHDTRHTGRRVLRAFLPIPIAMLQLGGTRFMSAYAPRHGQNRWWDNHDWSQLPGPPAWAYAIALIGPIALWWAHRYPRAVLGVTIGAAALFAALGYPTAATLWSVIAAVLIWIKRVRAERTAAARRARDAEAARRAGAERLRIAQELHDVLAHHISLINVQSGVALHLIDKKPEQTRTALAAIKGASKQALAALRGALDTLRDVGDSAPRQPTAGLDQLDTLVHSVRSAGLAVRVTTHGTPAALTPQTDLAALRIIQESLTNVLRHAEASNVDIELSYSDEWLAVTVSDDGAGGIPLLGNGITGMTERATALGGELHAGPRTGGGFTVRARLPL